MGDERSAARVGAATVNYNHAGAAGHPPVVLVHGLGGSAAVWRRNIPMLAEMFDVYALELWGEGRFEEFRKLDIGAGVKLVDGFLDAIGLKSAHLVGGSLGGLLCAAEALGRPGRVRSLTLVDSAGLGPEIAWPERFMTLPWIGELLFRPTRRRVGTMLRMLMPNTPPPSALVDDLFYASQEPGVMTQMLAALRAGVGLGGVKRGARLTDRLAEINVATLVCWGTVDPLFPIAHGRKAVEAIPHARLELFHGAGHWPFWEQPAHFNAFLASHISHAEGYWRTLGG